MLVEKIPTKKISDIVAEKIEEWISTGSVKPGDKLPSVRELCEMFDVGRSAVRDAITTLKGKGLVEVKQGDGTFVTRLDPSVIFYDLLIGKRDIKNLYTVRQILEIGTAEHAALHRRDENLVKMRDAIMKLEKAKTIDGWEADFEFHLAIAEATQNEVLVELMQTISNTTKKAILEVQKIILSDQKLSRMVFHQHLEIYEAIRKGRSTEARQAMLTHLTFVEGLLESR
jgi:GntR family transcriptional regulator, transcriptional repressor for pyruvate dehydrogenase complex